MADITNQQLLKAIDSKIVKTITANKQELLVAMTEQLGVITDNMVTKEDLIEQIAQCATKEDLKRFATKDDLGQFATKDDLSESTNRLDGRLDRIERRIIEGRKVNVQHHLTTRKMIGDLTKEHAALRQGIAKAVETL